MVENLVNSPKVPGRKPRLKRVAGRALRALCLLHGAQGLSKLHMASYLTSSALGRFAGNPDGEPRDVDLRLSGFDVRVQTFSSQLGSYADIFFLNEYEKVPGFDTKAGDVVIDAGANVGFFSLRHAPRVGPNGRVYAFEPNPLVFKLLERNVLRNGLTQVRCLQSALGETAGSVRFTSDPRASSCGHVAEGDEAGELVASTTLDDLVERENIERIDLLKMDVEGYEPHVLRGGLARALERTRRVVMESHNTRDSAWEILRPFGFRRVYDGHWPNVVYFARESA